MSRIDYENASAGGIGDADFKNLKMPPNANKTAMGFHQSMSDLDAKSQRSGEGSARNKKDVKKAKEAARKRLNKSAMPQEEGEQNWDNRSMQSAEYVGNGNPRGLPGLAAGPGR